MPRAFRGFNSGFIKASDRVIESVAFLSSSTQAAPVETITVKNISGTLTVSLVSTIEVSNGKLTQGAPNTCVIENSVPIKGLKVFLSRF